MELDNLEILKIKNIESANTLQEKNEEENELKSSDDKTINNNNSTK